MVDPSHLAMPSYFWFVLENVTIYINGSAVLTVIPLRIVMHIDFKCINPLASPCAMALEHLSSVVTVYHEICFESGRKKYCLTHNRSYLSSNICPILCLIIN